MASSKSACWPGWMRMSAISRITAGLPGGWAIGQAGGRVASRRLTSVGPNATLVDWHWLANKHPDYFVKDGFHLTGPGVNVSTEVAATGTKKFTLTLVDGTANTTFDTFAGPADSPEVARLPAHLDRRFLCCHNRGVLLEGQPERLPVPATTAFVRVCFSIAALPQRRHQGEPHGPGTTLTRHKWCNCTSSEWL